MKSGALNAQGIKTPIELQIGDPSSPHPAVYQVRSVADAVAFWNLAAGDVDAALADTIRRHGDYDRRVLPFVREALKMCGEDADAFWAVVRQWGERNQFSLDGHGLPGAARAFDGKRRTAELSAKIAKIERLIALGVAGKTSDGTSIRAATAVSPFSADQARELQKRCAQQLGLPIETVNSLNMKLVLVPDGEFAMGRDRGELAEGPRHLVRITEPFYMAIHVVTVAQFSVFADETGYKTLAEVGDKDRYLKKGVAGFVPGSTKRKWNDQYNWRRPGFQQEADHPVVNMSCADAVAFFKWLSKREGNQYRLPTEAEWEFACRAGSKTDYYFGDAVDEVGKYAWYDANSGNRTHAVGSKLPNPFGLYDMHGNVGQWCSDAYLDNYYSNSPAVDPQGPAHGMGNVVRGGSWRDSPADCRASRRDYASYTAYLDQLGVRVVRTIERRCSTAGGAPTAPSPAAKTLLATILGSSPEIPIAGQTLRVQIGGFASDGSPTQLEYSTNDKAAWTSASESELQLSDLKAGKLVLRVRAVDRRGLISPVVERVWNVRPVHPYMTWDIRRTLQRSKEEVRCVAYSPDSSLLAAGDAEKYSYGVSIWRADDGVFKLRLHHCSSPVEALCFSDDLSKIFCGEHGRSYGPISAWFLVATKETLPSEVYKRQRAPHFIREHQFGVSGLLMLRNGATLVSSGYDGLIRFHDLSQEKAPFKTLQAATGEGKDVWCLAADPEQKYLACGCQSGQVKLWRIEASPQPLKGAWNRSESVTSLAFCGRSGLLAASDKHGDIRVWNIEGGTLSRTLKDVPGMIWSLDASPDGAVLASGHDDGIVRLWSVSDGALVKKLEGHVGPVLSLHFRPDGKGLASGGRDRTVRLWGPNASP